MTTAPENITLELAKLASGLDLTTVPQAISTRVKLAILDWFGVTLAGANEPVTQHLLKYRLSEGGHPQCTIVGTKERMPASVAALVNGTASHALDYDDVSFSIPGHATAPVLAATLALAEQTHISGSHMMQAVLAGYETSCRMAQLIAPDHYARGFHATATIGCFGAATACARILGLDANATAQAMGIAAIKAAGLKAAFGSSCKPLQVGEAARNGLEAARLAQSGVEAPADMIGHRLGFAHTHSNDFHVQAALGPARYIPDFSTVSNSPATFDFHIQTNLFKFHAACYETHSAIESVLQLSRSERFSHDDIVAISIHVNPHCNDICNIQSPTTPLQAKFSLRHTVAMALTGRDTASPASFNQENLGCPDLLRLQTLAQVVLDPGLRVPQTLVRIRLADTRTLEHLHDSSLPESDLNALQARLVQKFHVLCGSNLSRNEAQRLEASLCALESVDDVGELLR